MSEDKIIHDLFYAKTHSVSWLHRSLQRSPIFKDLFKSEKEFPSFGEFCSHLNGQSKLFSIADGIKVLKAYYDFEPLTAAKKAENQTRLMEKRDVAGLLGKTVPRLIDKDKIEKKKVQSIWPVKKK